MSGRVEISGAPTEFEAAAIAAVVERINREEKAASGRMRHRDAAVRSAWVRALGQDRPGETRDRVFPDY